MNKGVHIIEVFISVQLQFIVTLGSHSLTENKNMWYFHEPLRSCEAAAILRVI